MGEAEWFRIVGRRRLSREEMLPARTGRFHNDPVNRPTSYLGGSLTTVWLEAQAARAGVARPNPEAFAGWRVILKDANLVDLRDEGARHRWGIVAAELAADPPPLKCRDLADRLRGDPARFHGVVYPSVRHRPDGACLALFLERREAILACERVSTGEWETFVKGLPPGKE